MSVAAEVMDATLVALIARWTADSALTTFLGGAYVFDRHVPEGLNVPRYIVVGEQTAVPRNAFDRKGSSTTLAAGAWTRGAPDRGDVVNIVRLMDAAVASPLTLTGFGTARLRNNLTAILGDPEDQTLDHAAVRYRLFGLELT